MKFSKKSLGSREHRELIALLVQKRRDAGLTQEDVAKQMRWPQSYISKIESGDRRLDVIEFIRIASVIGFDAGAIAQELQELIEK